MLYLRHRISERPMRMHKGVYKPQATMAEAVFMVTGMTIGAGILGIPYVVSQVGLLIGLAYIVVLGVVMLSLNLMVGEVAVRTKENLQTPGFAGKYLGTWAKELLSVTTIFSATGALLAYVVGEGQTLAALFGGNPAWWSVFFWSVGSFLVWRGLDTVKKIDKIFASLVIIIIAGLSIYLLRDFQIENLFYHNLTKIFLPYGVILFALHASPAVAEVHALLPGSQKQFRRALILGTIIPMIVYMLFALAVVGVSGTGTTGIATLGLGQMYGKGILFFANIFAIFAMATGFLGLGTALRQTLIWDHKISPFLSTLFVIGAPLALFMAGFRSFVAILDTVGGLFVGIEAVLMVLIYWRAKKMGDLDAKRYGVRYASLMSIPIVLVFVWVTLHSVWKIIQ